MSQNGVVSRHSAGISRPPSGHSSSSVSWGGHSSVTVATSQTTAQQQQPETPPGVDYETKLASLASPQSSNQSGSTLKEHDLLGLSEASSSRLDNLAPTFLDDVPPSEGLNLNLNLEATELRLGPQDSTRRKVDSAFPFQRNVQEQASSPSPPAAAAALEGVNFLDSVGESSRDLVSEKRSPVPEPPIVASGSEAVGFSYSSLAGETGGGGEGPAGCRPLISSDSLRLGISLSQPKRPANAEEVSEKKSFLNSIDRSFHQENLQEVKQQQLLAEDSPSGYQARAWQPGRNGTVVDAGTEEPSGAEGASSNLSEKRPLPAIVPPELNNRFQDSLADKSPRHNPQWHTQVMMRSSAEASRQMQQDESPRNGYPGPHGGFPGGRVAFAPAKPGVSGAKRPFDTIGTGTPSGVVSVSSNDADNKLKAQQQQPPPTMYQSWTPKQGPPWQMLHSGGSFGPFPSQTPGRNIAGPAPETAAGADSVQQKAYTKNLQESTEPEPAPAAATEAVSAPRATCPPAHAVGWPPLRSFRKSTIASQPIPSPVETQPRPAPPPAQAAPQPSVARQSNSWRVKVFLDGVPIGRKVDLEVYSSYEKLSAILDDMFRDYVRGQQSGKTRNMALPDPEPFLHGSDYVLTYEDQDRDLMLVGDVPWTMFINTVKRLRIMKGSEAIGLGSRAAEKAANKNKGKV